MIKTLFPSVSRSNMLRVRMHTSSIASMADPRISDCARLMRAHFLSVLVAVCVLGRLAGCAHGSVAEACSDDSPSCKDWALADHCESNPSQSNTIKSRLFVICDLRFAIAIFKHGASIWI